MLATLGEAVPGERVDHLLARLPADCADLFGRRGGPEGGTHDGR
ncbi:hypothetical protein ACFUVQ_10180 [Streptomyces rochei]